MMVLGGIPAKENHKAPGKSIAGDGSRRHGKTLVGTPARPLSGPWQDPCRGRGKALAKDTCGATSDPHQSRLHHRSLSAADPTSWAGTCVAACKSSWRPTAAPP